MRQKDRQERRQQRFEAQRVGRTPATILLDIDVMMHQVVHCFLLTLSPSASLAVNLRRVSFFVFPLAISNCKERTFVWKAPTLLCGWALSCVGCSCNRLTLFSGLCAWQCQPWRLVFLDTKECDFRLCIHILCFPLFFSFS